MGRIEADIAEIKGALMAMQSSIAQLQIGFPDAYVTRREFTEHKADQERSLNDIDHHVDKVVSDIRDQTGMHIATLAKRTDTLDTRVWALISGMALTFLGAIVALLRTIPQLPHG